MKLKYIMIASLALNLAIFALLFMQKGAYVSQAEEAYQKKTEAYYKQALNIVDGQNSVIENNAVLWHIACTANQQAKTSKDFATIEKRLASTLFSAKVSGTPMETANSALSPGTAIIISSLVLTSRISSWA